jgi:hypothetical protein
MRNGNLRKHLRRARRSDYSCDMRNFKWGSNLVQNGDFRKW